MRATRAHPRIAALHRWTGLLLAPVLILIAISALWLGHGGPIQPLFERPDILYRQLGDPRGKLSQPLAEAPAVMFARKLWPGERLGDLKIVERNGHRLFEIANLDAQIELQIDPLNENYALRHRYQKVFFDRFGAELGRKYYLKRFVTDLHTGAIGYRIGRILWDLTAVALLLFVATGLYLWRKEPRPR